MKAVIFLDLPRGIVEIGGLVHHVDLPAQHVALGGVMFARREHAAWHSTQMRRS